jgi:hypothetical protein
MGLNAWSARITEERRAAGKGSSWNAHEKHEPHWTVGPWVRNGPTPFAAHSEIAARREKVTVGRGLVVDGLDELDLKLPLLAEPF